MRVSFDRLQVRLGQRRITEDLSACFDWYDDAGDRVIALMGPSGSGKTTLAREILNARYGAPGEPAIQIEPRDAVIAHLPQHPVLFSHLSFSDNARLLKQVGRYRKNFDLKLFESLVRVLRLEQLLNSNLRSEQMSGGEAQRLMLLRTLSVRPDLLILDEPAVGLDPAVREDFLFDLASLLDRLKINALYITHHWDEVRFLARRLAYAELTQAGVIHRLATVDFNAFADAPPTVDAFKTVHAPGCSVWPLLRGELACFAPPADGPSSFRTGATGNRMAHSIAARLTAGDALHAAIYREGQFAEWRAVSLGELKDWH